MHLSSICCPLTFAGMKKKEIQGAVYITPTQRSLVQWGGKCTRNQAEQMQSFGFVQLRSLCICLPIGPRSIVLELCTLLLVFFSFLQKVSGQQILERCIQDFIFGFVVHIYALARIQIQMIQLAWIPKCLPSFYFISREKLWKRDFFLLLTIFQKSSNKAELKLHRHHKGPF